MQTPSEVQAWLECLGGEMRPITDTFLIGRSADCQVVLRDQKVSRRHCMINRQGSVQFWLIDLQSANGTRLNGRRLVQAALLRDGDRIELAGYDFKFHQPTASESGDRQTTTVTMTIQEIRHRQCWLLVGDLVGSTSAMDHLDAEDAANLTGRWLAQCRKVLEEHGGAINKYLGDGFFAYWLDEPEVELRVSTALQKLGQLQREAQPSFRIVLHYGAIVFGGAPSMGEESMAGREVNFIFRMENLASKLGATTLLSEAAASKLQALPSAEVEGTHRLQGFEGEFKFFTL